MPAPLASDLFDLDPAVLWVMHCAEGPVPRASAEAVRAFLSKETQPWTLNFQTDFVDGPSAVRAEAAKLVGGHAEDITLTPTTSSGLVLVARGFPFRPDDEVLAPLGEFSTNSWPWLGVRDRGVTLRLVPLWEGHVASVDAWRSTRPKATDDIEARLLNAIGRSTKVMTVSWVRFQDGLVLDLRRLARGCAERGVALVVDGIQGAGTLSIPIEGVSAFATGGYKGLLAPEGLGFLWTNPEFRSRMAPLGSWLSVEAATDFTRSNTDLTRAWKTDGTKLEQGGPDMLSGAALLASLRLLNETGVARIAEHVRGLHAKLIEGLAKIPAWRSEAERLSELLHAGRIGSVLSLHHGTRGPAGLQRILDDGLRQGIYASIREGYLRIALHGFHTEADVERLLRWLAQS